MSLLRGVVSRRRSGPRGNLVGAAEAAPTGSFTPGSTAPAQQAAADLHQVAEAQLSIAVLVEHRAEQAAAEAALLADVLLFLAEDAAEGVGIRARRLATVALEHALGQVRHHDRREDLQQLVRLAALQRSEEHTSELQSLMRISYAVFCLKKKKYNR